jgi:hypothetical protein
MKEESLIFKTKGVATTIIIRGGGDARIGTTAPKTKLHVVGIKEIKEIKMYERRVLKV